MGWGSAEGGGGGRRGGNGKASEFVGMLEMWVCEMPVRACVCYKVYFNAFSGKNTHLEKIRALWVVGYFIIVRSYMREVEDFSGGEY